MKRTVSPKRTRRAFSLIEIMLGIVLIAILSAVAYRYVSSNMLKARISSTVSDMSNFTTSIETAMMENSGIGNATVKTDSQFTDFVRSLENNLPQGYKLGTALDTDVSAGNIQYTVASPTAYAVYKVDAKDPWDNNYYVLVDTTAHKTGTADFTVTVISAGPNGKTNITGAIDADDIFVLAQYQDGEIALSTNNVADLKYQVVTYGTTIIARVAAGELGKYTGSGSTDKLPVNLK